MGRKIFSRIIIAVCLVALAVLVLLIARDHVNEKARVARMEKQYNKVNDKINALYQKRDALTDEIETVKEKLRTSDEKLATVTLVLSEPDSELVSTAEEELKKYSYKANIAVSMNRMPGDTGCISIDKMKSLTDAGWEIVIYPDKPEEIKKINTRLAAEGLPGATAVVIDRDDNAGELLSQAKECGIKVILAGPGLEFESEEYFIRIPMYGYRTEGIKDKTETMINKSETIAFGVSPAKSSESIGNAGTENLYDITVFSQMLAVISKYTESEDCKVSPVSEAGTRYAKHLKIYGDALESSGKTIEQIEAEIEEINAEISSIHDGF